ncbi:hypothetical protein [Sphingobacterium sp. LRF_L2]|uniref:hypothetical protein n=1 Tax=Sphingobacterium sp. LRF_L2 TaxID=3369421 RepID=UPI003F61026E
MANLTKNHGFDKCGSFDEIAMLSLSRTLDINESGVANVNIRISKKCIDLYFYQEGKAEAVYYSHGILLSGNTDLEGLDEAFKKYEVLNMEVEHA